MSVLLLAHALLIPAGSARAQQPQLPGAGPTLAELQAAARAASPELRAARAAVAAARARERQAGAFPNPTLGYGREQTSGGGQSNAQDIAQVDQPFELGRQRSARRDAARIRGDIADARLVAAERQLDFDVARAYGTVVATARRAALAEEAAAAFTEAGRVITQRLAAGDVSGYAARRLQLEVARYAAQRADAMLALRVARTDLAALVALPADSVPLTRIEMLPAEGAAPPLPPVDSLRTMAWLSRADLRALTLESAAAAADARLAAAERIPSPTLSAGYKRESVSDITPGRQLGLQGFVLGVALPLPLFDRRSASIEAGAADVRRRDAEADVLRRRIRLEVEETYAALEALEAQLELLRPQLGDNARAAMRAVQAAYTEGEITLVEWLDAVRAYHEAESTFATLQADATIRRAALERAVGIPLLTRSTR
jgi:outer membrane protein, heavy metal efflux system